MSGNDFRIPNKLCLTLNIQYLFTSNTILSMAGGYSDVVPVFSKTQGFKVPYILNSDTPSKNIVVQIYFD
jgi:hypothetical protein